MINLEWHGRSGTLICRVVTKFGNKPNSIVGDFIDYLLARHQGRILSVTPVRTTLEDYFLQQLGADRYQPAVEVSR